MNIFKDLLNALKKSVRTFPATVLGSFATAVAAVTASAGREHWDELIDDARDTFGGDSHQVEALRNASDAFGKICLRWGMAAAFSAVFAFLAGLLCICVAKSFGKKDGLSPFKKELGRNISGSVSLALQILCIPLCILLFFLLKDTDSPVVQLRYWGCALAMLAVSIYLLHSVQDEGQVAPNTIVAMVIAGIASSCLLFGLMLVTFAFHELIYKFSSSTPYFAVVCFTYMVFGVNVLIAYMAREGHEISIPKPFTVIMSYVLFPLTMVLLAVLYGYLLKCLVTHSMPVGQINPFVSIATALFFIFYVSLEGKVKFFHKWGNFLFLPLIPLQIIAYSIRVNAYGFTESRVASLYYIIASVVFCLLPLVRRGRYMKFSYLLIAVFCLLATCGPLDIFSVTLRSQCGRVVSVFKSHGLYEDGKISPDVSGVLSLEEKATIVSAYDKLEDMELGNKFPSWWTERAEDEYRTSHFQKLFGFEWSRSYDRGEDVDVSYGYSYSLDTDASPAVLDVSAYVELFTFDISDWYNRNDLTSKAEHSTKPNVHPEISLPSGEILDITEELESRLKEQGRGGDDEKDNIETGTSP
ncbi:MAG: DUF4153 domain-containing protein, partial [Treponema sp.]|nr:DUF4153 domain-containing protein [Treponema sp.]